MTLHAYSFSTFCLDFFTFYFNDLGFLSGLKLIIYFVQMTASQENMDVTRKEISLIIDSLKKQVVSNRGTSIKVHP